MVLSIIQLALVFLGMCTVALMVAFTVPLGTDILARTLSVISRLSFLIHSAWGLVTVLWFKQTPLPAVASFTFFTGIYVVLQITGHTRLNRLQVSPIEAGWASIRFSLSTLGGFMVYFLTDYLCSLGLSATAPYLNLPELGRELFTWLRPPTSLFVATLFSKVCEEKLFAIAYGAKPLSKSLLTSRLNEIVTTHHLRAEGGQAEFRKLPGQEYGMVCVRAFENRFSLRKRKLTLYISHDIADHLNEREVEYLTLRELAALRTRQSHRSLLLATVFFLLILLPYLLLVQISLFTLPSSFILPAWCLLYVALFTLQISVTSSLEKGNEIERLTLAGRLLKWSQSDIVQLYQKLSRLNTSRIPAPFLFRLPALPKSKFFPENKKHAQARAILSWRRTLSGAAAMAVATIIFGVVVLSPRHQLVVAAQEGDDVTVRALLQKGLNPDSEDIFSNGLTPLLSASRNGSEETLGLLLDAKANPNRFHPFGISPLLLSAERGWTPGVRMLIEHHADVNYRGFKGYTPLMLAATHGHVEVTRLLLESGAQINERTEHGSTALMLAIQSRRPETVTELLRYRPSLQVRDRDGDSALDLARRKGLTSIERALASQPAQ